MYKNFLAPFLYASPDQRLRCTDIIKNRYAMNCPACNASNRPEAHFCDSCGVPLSINIVCRSCKSENRAGARFCDSCGAAFSRYKSAKQGSTNLKIVLGGVCALLVIGLGVKYGGAILSLKSPASEQPAVTPLTQPSTSVLATEPSTGEVVQDIKLFSQSIRTKVMNSWVRPISATPGLKCKLQVKLLPSGEVTEVVVFASSGDLVFDRSVENAVRKASPFPVPSNRTTFDQKFKVLTFVFKPD